MDLHLENYSYIETMLSSIEDMQDGDSSVFDVTEEKVLPAQAIDLIKGRDIEIVLEIEDSYSWAINGQDVSAQLGIDSSNQGSLIFTLPTIPAGATANIIYKAQVNDFAPLALDSTIINTSTFESNSECADATASAIVSVANAANISIIKQMCPNPVICGETITYTIRIYNYGNTAAENVIVTDDFNPAPDNITVSRDGVLLLGTDYTYINGSLSITTALGESVTVPPATFSQDPVTGSIIIIPSVVEYTITGTI